MTSNMRVQLPEELHYSFKNKCQFYDIPMQDAIAHLLQKFVDGDFDEEFNIKKVESNL